MKDLSIFENKFDESSYKELVKNLFNRFDFSKELTLKNQFNEAEKLSLEDFTYLGTFEDAEKKSLDVLIVELKGGSKVERARSLQRNLIGKYLKGNLKDSALVAFYSKDNPDWRFSFVKMDFKIGDKGAKVEIGTPPKRYSFLVGETEPSYTAKKQLRPFLDDKVIPTVDGIEEAFSIEKVTKEFYNKIAEMFTKLVGGERKIGSRKVVESGSLKLPSTNDDTTKKEFAVRLIGRLLFCWFLKKKKSGNDIPLISPAILSFTAMEMHPNYYHSLLEPLFFQVLNTPMEKRNKRVGNDLWNKIPFLNGGLFEPHQHDFYVIDDFGTSRHLNTLKVPDEWFAELFKIFEEYNFTIDESSTIDIEISVDPEMLGRIFENLLAEINPETGETARKSTGSYYTPRPIVEYMVDESLKQYLITQTGIEEVKIAKLLSYAEDDMGMTETEKGAIIDALDRVKIIDPACGSGAFPMGILHKMLLILQKIDPQSKKWLNKKIKDATVRRILEAKLKDESWDYIRKLGIIRDSIYGVDIQLIAVEISKLRFFLSLVVDERVYDNEGNRGIEPLPNLEFKFVAANSLIGLPKLWDQVEQGKQQKSMAESHGDIENLRGLREEYFTAYGDDKRRIEKKFKEIQSKMLLQSIKWKAVGSQTMKLSEWNPFEDKASSWFDPEWMFGIKNPSPLAGEGKGEGGFDIVIANPPYIVIKDETLRKLYRESIYGRPNSYGLFIHLSISKLMNEKGILTFINPKTILTDSYTSALRKYILKNSKVIALMDITSRRDVFEAVLQSVIVNIFFKGKNDDSVKIYAIRNKRDIYNRNPLVISQKRIVYGSPDNPIIVLSDKVETYNIMDKILRFKTFFEKEIKFTTGKIQWDLYKNILSGTPQSKQAIQLVWAENIQRYYFQEASRRKDKMYINGSLKSCNPVSGETIVVQRTTAVEQERRIIAHLINPQHFGYPIQMENCTSYIENYPSNINLSHILGLLNSKLFDYIFRHVNSNTHVSAGELNSMPYAFKNSEIFSRVNKILSTKQKDPNTDTSTLEQQIDKLVYALYELTPEEIKVVENLTQ